LAATGVWLRPRSMKHAGLKRVAGTVSFRTVR